MKLPKIAFNTVLFISILTIFSACNGQHKNTGEPKSEKVTRISIGDTVSVLGKDIACILQDKSDNYWFASNGEGVYRYDGKTLFHISKKDGLCSNFVLDIQEDIAGNLWFSTRNGICRFDGTSFSDVTNPITNVSVGNIKLVKGGLFLGHLNGVCYYDGATFTNFTIQPITYIPKPYDMSRPYSIYCSLIDKSGNAWFGTEGKGVCKFDGKTVVFFTEKGLSENAVRCIFQTKDGNLWFGNNGRGLFRYNGQTVTNFTDENGLENPEFLKSRKIIDKLGTIARVWTLNDDTNGNLWIGTIDAGVWKYDGKKLTNYTTKDGLAGNSIWKIFKDKKGELWFVTNGETICKFNGKSFTKFSFK